MSSYNNGVNNISILTTYHYSQDETNSSAGESLQAAQEEEEKYGDQGKHHCSSSAAAWCWSHRLLDCGDHGNRLLHHHSSHITLMHGNTAMHDYAVMLRQPLTCCGGD